MTAPKPCGRLDAHPAPHTWTRPPSPFRAGRPNYVCNGAPKCEGGWTCLACDQPAVEGAFCDYHGRRVA